MVKFQVVVCLSCLLLVWALVTYVAADSKTDECRVARCFTYDQEIRFPFWLKHEQPEHCGLPGFQLFCHRGKTEMVIQYFANTSLHGIQLLLSMKAAVVAINYTSQEIILDYGYESETSNLKLVSASTSLMSSKMAPSPFRLISHPEIVTFVSCSSRHEGSYFPPSNMLTSLSGKVFPVHLFTKDDTISMSPITSCIKIFHSYGILLSDQVFNWSIPQEQPKRGQESIKPIAGSLIDGAKLRGSSICLWKYTTSRSMSSNILFRNLNPFGYMPTYS
ncbi:hypothetical protein POM88_012661 [Heracleum sosnowskyi]|uniref:RING-type E3 ubiquitin transferase n=1 Tax=Heracleum sosnowskyi TaxID=360622 RepID=A0AAD8IX58_9APIA|nr:hypothetical protein POM88_012661 [Heracleum sosnowskyi]